MSLSRTMPTKMSRAMPYPTTGGAGDLIAGKGRGICNLGGDLRVSEMKDHPEQPSAPNMRSFSLNSDEAYEALCPRQERPWIPNGALPREPRVWGLPVIVEGRRR
jgi:hypothetical protein